MGTLYLVATPIGNLEDISPRAIRTLKESILVAAEDTRVTRKLLSHFDIHTSLTSYYEHNKLDKLDLILESLAQGDVALVSDAGTPAINDPGYELVRAALSAGYNVRPVPGPSAPVAALSASGLPTDTFLYLGYLPRKSSERRLLLESIANQSHTLIFLETPHRLLTALDDLQSTLGDRQMSAARELTKLHEEIFRGTITQTKEYFTSKAPRGEFTLVVAGIQKRETKNWTRDELLAAIRSSLEAGEAPSQLAGRLSKESGWKRREIYQLIQKLKS
ncbi:MAG: 16S rRNA (cytidine(1402)-2'-O)-methyltransferase [Anaerolineales bacterium]|nr:16S rRNA (cytidine(1402)-2'-O)-methyltransferase [Anaerolineales bacterium]